MALERQAVSVSFAQGLETKNDPKQVVAGKLLTLENGVLTSPGRIAKRNGYAALPALPTTLGQFIGPYGNETVASDGLSLYSLEAATNTWQNKGSCRSVGISRTSIVKSRLNASLADSAINAGLLCTVYSGLTPGAAAEWYYTITDVVSGEIVVQDALLDASLPTQRPRVVALGTTFLVIFLGGGGVGWRVISTATPAVVGAFVVADAAGTAAFDAIFEPINARVYIATSTAAAGGTIKIGYTSNGTSFNAGSSKVPGALLAAVGIFADAVNGNVVVGYWPTAGANIIYWGVTSAFVDVWGPTNIIPVSKTPIAITGYSSNNVGAIFCGERDNGGGPPFPVFFAVKSTFTAGTPGAPANFNRSLAFNSRPLLLGSTYVILMQFSGQPNICPYLLLDLLSGSVLARVAQEDGVSDAGTSGYPLRDLSPLPSGAYSISIAVVSRTLLNIAGTSVTFSPGVDNLAIDFVNLVNRYQTATIANALHINGGMLQMYDGGQVVEHGFHTPPEGLTAVDGGAAGASLSAGQYQWTCLYEWMDAKGAIHQSAPSPVTTVAGWTLNHQATIVVPTLRISAKSGIIIRIYRTAADGSVFYMVNQLVTDAIFNDPTVDTITFTDKLPDNVLIAHPLLYTQQQVSASPGPPCTSLTTYRNRLMLISAEEPTSIWYSLQVVPGQPAQMSDFLIQNVDPADAPLTALGVMDDKLAIFKAHQAMYMTGDGPDSLGNNNTFSTPITIDAASGCIYPSSVVTMNNGIMRQSAKGIRLLSRGLVDSYIGEGVEALTTGQQVVGAEVIPFTNEVRFDLFNGTVLVWDYYLEQWASFVFPEAIQNHRASAICAGVFTIINNTGHAYQETPGVYTDAGSAITTKIVTSWLQFAGLQGFQRAYKLLVLGDFFTSHILNVQIAYDFNPAIVQSDATQIIATPEQFRVFLARQKCEAIQVTISDQQANPGGQSVAISALALEIGVKRGAYKLPAANSFG